MNSLLTQRLVSARKAVRSFSAPLLLLLAYPILFILTVPAAGYADGAVPTALISETEASAAGLTRPWFNQVTMNPHHDRITQVTLQDDTLFITSDNGWIHVIDTNTGNTLWSRRVGSEQFYSLPPAANSYAVVVLHGSTIHVFDRFDGKKLLEFQIHGPAGGGPQVSERYIYVPILTGKIFAYPLRRYKPKEDALESALKDEPKPEDENGEKIDQEKANRIREAVKRMAADKQIEKKGLMPIDETEIQMCPALGEPLVQPFLCTQNPDVDYFSWVTTSGSLMIANLEMRKQENALQLLYSVMLAPQSMFIDLKHYKEVDLDFGNDINTRPTFVQKDPTDANAARGGEAKGGLILMGARSGYVFAVNDMLGTPEWTFPVGMAVIDPIGVADDNCFIPTYTGNFFCLNIKDGKLLWSIRDIKQFVSATKTRLYALDMLGNLLVINRDNGQTIHSIPLTTGMRGVFNIESDRIFLIGADGLVQCLHETQFDKAVRYQDSSMDIAEQFQKRIDNAFVTKQGGSKKAKPAEMSEEEKAEIYGDDDEAEDDEIFGNRSKPKSSADEDEDDDWEGSSLKTKVEDDEDDETSDIKADADSEKAEEAGEEETENEAEEEEEEETEDEENESNPFL